MSCVALILISHIFYYSFCLVDYFLGRVRCPLDSWHTHRHYYSQTQESAGKKRAKRGSVSNSPISKRGSKGTLTADSLLVIILYKHKPDTVLQLHAMRAFH